MAKDREFYRQIGRKGGKTTAQKYGTEHMSKIGRKGQMVTTLRWFGGSSQAHKEWLSEMGSAQYFKMYGGSMKRDRWGFGIWPEEAPRHPAEFDQPQPEDWVRAQLELALSE